jgi:L-cysteine desulfidase
MQQEIVPAIGCTEPVAVALCTAKACSVLGRRAEKIEAFLSANVLKNALGVGIPGTGMTGLPIAIALGALTGKPEESLELLKHVTAEEVEQGKRFIEEKRIEIHRQTGITDKLYIRIRCSGGGESAVAVIAGSHNHFTYIEKNGETLLDAPIAGSKDDKAGNGMPLNFRTVYEYAVESPVEELSFILEAARMNKKASDEAMLHSYGHNVAGCLKNRSGRHIFGNNLHARMIISTAGACDMRMDGALIPVMSNSGSGNQGIAATMPVLTFAESESCSDEQLIRALALSSLLIIYIKQQLGRLSALCGCVVASTGSSCGITYLMGGSYEQIVFAAKNMIANITGMICDGAKPGCALKIASGVSTAALSAVMAIENEGVSSQEGIIDEDIDRTIENLARIGNGGMQETDDLVLDIMTKK